MVSVGVVPAYSDPVERVQERDAGDDVRRNNFAFILQDCARRKREQPEERLVGDGYLPDLETF